MLFIIKKDIVKVVLNFNPIVDDIVIIVLSIFTSDSSMLLGFFSFNFIIHISIDLSKYTIPNISRLLKLLSFIYILDEFINAFSINDDVVSTRPSLINTPFVVSINFEL